MRSYKPKGIEEQWGTSVTHSNTPKTSNSILFLTPLFTKFFIFLNFLYYFLFFLILSLFFSLFSEHNSKRQDIYNIFSKTKARRGTTQPIHLNPQGDHTCSQNISKAPKFPKVKVIMVFHLGLVYQLQNKEMGKTQAQRGYQRITTRQAHLARKACQRNGKCTISYQVIKMVKPIIVLPMRLERPYRSYESKSKDL